MSESQVKAQKALADLAAYFLRVEDLWEGPDGCGTPGTELCEKIASSLLALASLPMALGLTQIPNCDALADAWWLLDSYEPPDAAIRAGGNCIGATELQAMAQEELHPDDLALRIWYAMRREIAKA